MSEKVTYEEFKEFMMNVWNYDDSPCISCNWAPDLYKLPVVGHVIITCNDGDNITSYPITSCDEYTDSEMGGYELRYGEKVITVLPATMKMFRVCSYIPEGSPEEVMAGNYTGCDFKVLGYEREGLPIPDWDKMYREECLSSVWGNREKLME